MGQIVVRSCDYDGCDQIEAIVADHEFHVIEEDDETGIIEDMPLEVVGDITWCDYEPETFPDGRYLCHSHERQVRTERGITLYGAMR